jgi:predicted flap endonuclease-1-like 5' DNA nuclease
MSRSLRSSSLAAFTFLVGVGASARASNYEIQEIPQAIPAADAAKLRAVGVTTTFALLEKGGEVPARKALARQAKIPEKTLEGWIQMADLLRIKGIGPDVARLLAAAGVHTVAQLRTADAEKLEGDILKLNETKKLSENPPSKEHLAAWIAQSKELPIVLK